MNEWQKFGSGVWFVDVCNWVIAAKGGRQLSPSCGRSPMATWYLDEPSLYRTSHSAGNDPDRSIFVIFSLVVGVAHYGFDVPIYDRNTGEPSSDMKIGLLLAFFAGVGLLFALLGRTILRAAARHKLAG